MLLAWAILFVVKEIFYKPEFVAVVTTREVLTTNGTKIKTARTSPRQPEKHRIVVSLKTMPSRIPYIEETLISLLVHQSMQLDRLYLVLPQTKWFLPSDNNKDNVNINSNSNSNHYEIPAFLTHLALKDTRVTILRPEYDYGPVDKMVYALQREKHQHNTNLIYLDDDVIYHRDLIKTLVTKGREYPDSVVALSGCTLRSHFR